MRPNRSSMQSAAVSLFLLGASSACGESHAPGAQNDAATVVADDGGDGSSVVPIDAGFAIDAGPDATAQDSGTSADAGSPMDASTAQDSGAMMDAGTQQRTYYVSNAGSDSANGLTLSTSFRTLNYAVGVVRAGDVIEVRAGTYAENVVIRRGGSASAWITMRGYNGERPILRGTNSGPTVYFYNSACDEDVIQNGSGNTDCYGMYWVLGGLEIRGSASGGGDGNAVKIDTPKVRLVGNRLCCSVADVVKLVRTANEGEILDNEIWQDATVTSPGTNAQGVDIVGADRVRVAGNYIHDVPDFGVYAKGNARDAVFEANRLVAIGRSDNGHALMLGQETDEERLVDGDYETYDGIIRNNVVVGSTWACLAVSSSFNARVYNNSCFNTAQNSQGSFFMSNESIIGQTSATISFVNNIVVGSPSRPIIKINADAMSDFTTLTFARNIYWTTSGVDPTFNLRGSNLSKTTWFTGFMTATTHADTSTVVNPFYESTTGEDPLIPSASSSARNSGFDSRVLVPTDRRGVARPQSGAVDVGAYEH